LQPQSLKAAIGPFPIPISLTSKCRIFVNRFRDVAFGYVNLIQWDRQIYSSWQ